MAVVSLWTLAAVPTIPANPATTPIEVGLRFSTSTAGSVTGLRFYKASTNTGTHTGTLWADPGGTALATVTVTGETASGWQTATFTTSVAISTGQNYVVSVFDPNGQYPSDQNYFTTPLVNAPLTGITGVFHNTTSAFPASTYNASNYWVDVLLDTGTTTTPLSGALVETDTVGAALSITSTPLTATLALVPTSGIIPFTVTATCTATGGGATKSYAWTWGDGTTTAAGPSNVATHLVTSSGIYTTSCTVV